MLVLRRLLALPLSLGLLSACSSTPRARAPEAPFLRASPIVEHGPPSVGPSSTQLPSDPLDESQPEIATTDEAPRPAAHDRARAPHPTTPSLPAGVVIAHANDLASQAPEESGFVNAVMTYAFVAGGFYKVFAAPWHVTDITLEPGEEILGPIAGGDPVRWRVDVGSGGVNGVSQKHIFIKPLRVGLKTNFTITTDRRTYLLNLESLEDTFMVSVQWTYSDERRIPMDSISTTPPAPAPTAKPTDIDRLHFDYVVEIASGKPAFIPRAVYDDGVHTYVRFDHKLLTSEAPALYVLERGHLQLVNYRLKDTLYIVDRLFDLAELRVGTEDQDIIRLRRKGSI